MQHAKRSRCFARRFWIAGLPSVLPAELLARTRDGDISLDEYCHELAGTVFGWMERLGERELRAVALRRSVQTRAYFAWTLQHILRERLFVVPHGVAAPAADVDALVEQLADYLRRLEETLVVLRDEHREARGPLWSVRLSDANPASGTFRELLFVYH